MDTAGAIFRTGPLGGLVLAPGECLGVQIVEVCEPAGSKEVLADKTDRPLDPAFLVATGDCARRGWKWY